MHHVEKMHNRSLLLDIWSRPLFRKSFRQPIQGVIIENFAQHRPRSQIKLRAWGLDRIYESPLNIRGWLTITLSQKITFHVRDKGVWVVWSLISRGVPGLTLPAQGGLSKKCLWQLLIIGDHSVYFPRCFGQGKTPVADSMGILQFTPCLHDMCSETQFISCIWILFT